MRKNISEKYLGFIRKNKIMIGCASLALGVRRCDIRRTDKALFGASNEDIRAEGHYIA